MALDDHTRELLETLATLVDPTDAHPSTEDEVVEAERRLGRPLPAELRWWVMHVGDTAAVGGDLSLNTRLVPEAPDDRHDALTTAADQLNAWDWEIPEELIVFGNNGGGEPLGIWAPLSGGGIPAVVCVGSGHSEADPCLWIIGDSFSHFLRGYLASYAFWYEDQDEIHDLLHIPELIRPVEEDEDPVAGDPLSDLVDDGLAHRILLRYTSPSLGDLVSEAWHERRLSTEELRQALGA